MGGDDKPGSAFPTRECIRTGFTSINRAYSGVDGRGASPLLARLCAGWLGSETRQTVVRKNR